MPYVRRIIAKVGPWPIGALYGFPSRRGIVHNQHQILPPHQGSTKGRESDTLRCQAQYADFPGKHLMLPSRLPGNICRSTVVLSLGDQVEVHDREAVVVLFHRERAMAPSSMRTRFYTPFQCLWRTARGSPGTGIRGWRRRCPNWWQDHPKILTLWRRSGQPGWRHRFSRTTKHLSGHSRSRKLTWAPSHIRDLPSRSDHCPPIDRISRCG